MKTHVKCESFANGGETIQENATTTTTTTNTESTCIIYVVRATRESISWVFFYPSPAREDSGLEHLGKWIWAFLQARLEKGSAAPGLVTRRG